jgi:hypothetical protein
MNKLYLNILLLFCSIHSFAYIINSGVNSIEISPKNGAVVNVLKNGKSVATSPNVAFAMRLIDKDGNYVCLDNSNFKDFKFVSSTAIWSGCEKYPDLKVSMKVSTSNGDFRFRPRVDSIPNDLILEYIEAPRLNVPLKNELLFLWSEGL